VERDVPPDDYGWLQATFRLHSLEGAAVELLSLGPNVEVLQPDGLREHVAELVHRTALLYPGPPSTSVDRGDNVAEDTIWTMPD
jgi:hypothetical protein